MKNLILSFGIGILFLFLFANVQATQELEVYYKLNLNYSYGDIKISLINIEFFSEKKDNFLGTYFAEVLDYEENVLEKTFFGIPNKILYDTIDENGAISGGGIIELNETSFEVFVPYYENAKEIIIYGESSNELTRKNVNEYSKLYNKVSESNESKIVREVGKQIPEGENLTENIVDYWWILLIILVILLVILFHSLNKIKK